MKHAAARTAAGASSLTATFKNSYADTKQPAPGMVAAPAAAAPGQGAIN